MYKININGIDNKNQYDELIKVFLQPNEYEFIENTVTLKSEMPINFSFKGDKNLLKREIYEYLSSVTSKKPKWGILTGIRPVKLAGEIFDKTGSLYEVKKKLDCEYLLNEEKSDLVTEILQIQRNTLGIPIEKSISIYIGIPFCPTRCLYCSFTSNQVENHMMDRYLEALIKEILYCADRLKYYNYKVESLYIGGGTPTTLDETQLERLLNIIAENFTLDTLKEYTVEAGRPDTITVEKLKILKKYGVGRISINPQTMKDKTLKLIGRAHDVAQTEEAFKLTKDAGFKWINADLIAGLPEETFDDFKNSINRVIDLGAENITLHTLAVKRASKLKEVDSEFNYKNESLCEKMLSYAHHVLRNSGYKPYYLYRQKHTSGNTENIGFCKNDLISVYNVRIMEEAQSILALGAGGISKVYYPEENRLERVANVSNYEVYIDRIDEMIQRKEDNFWR